MTGRYCPQTLSEEQKDMKGPQNTGEETFHVVKPEIKNLVALALTLCPHYPTFLVTELLHCSAAFIVEGFFAEEKEKGRRCCFAPGRFDEKDEFCTRMI